MSRGYFDQHGNYVPHHPIAVEAKRIADELLDQGPVCPECEVRKHENCNGQAWDDDADAGVSCVCWAGGHLIQPTVVR